MRYECVALACWFLRFVGEESEVFLLSKQSLHGFALLVYHCLAILDWLHDVYQPCCIYCKDLDCIFKSSEPHLDP